ncbi:MAG: hypothetical protein H8F28_04390 [Fibrella sp.]|nr:hypothetical protein [Armatimonadota bacterium]
MTSISAFAAEPGKLSVREVTIFKDGHTFVQREGNLPVGNNSTAVLDELPIPILGTFWSYSADKAVSVRAVTATQHPVSTVRDAASVRELLAANTGLTVTIRENGPGTPAYSATVLSLRGENLVLLQTAEGVRLVTLASIAEVTLHGDKPKLTITDTTTRPQLSLTLQGVEAGGTANLGVMYLQKGLRWIPGYKVVIDPASGKAHVSLQGTLVNELADLSDVTAHLVIGVPKWDFAGEVDPIALQETLVQLSAQFNGARANSISNAIMTQTAGYYRSADSNENTTPPPAVSGSESREDFHIFTVKNVSLKRGERMVIPVAEFTLSYTDVYKLELAPAPPREWQQAYYSGNANQLPAELASLLSAPKVKHYLRLRNTSAYPLTTAPALLLSGERVLSQGTMTYTPRNGETDLPLATASNITVKRTDKETGRVPNVKQWNNYSFEQVDLAGTICLTNYGAKPALIEVNRYVLGTVTQTSEGGTAETLDLFSGSDSVPTWWSSYNLPNDLGRFNGLGRATWETTVPPGKSVDLTYSWRYLWR